MKYACGDCGNEQDSDKRCEKCNSLRLGTTSFMESVLGPKWREAFKPDGKLIQEDMPAGTTLLNPNKE